jgi:RNA polymerase sigma-70 factor (ECF subfamily)
MFNSVRIAVNSEKYELLIKQYKNKIYGYAYYMLKNRMDADDITQEVFIRIWKNIDKFNLSSAKPWIMKTTHNLCIDYLRKNQVSTQRQKDIEETVILTDEEIVYKKNQLKERIRNGIESLPENLRSIFILYELQGFKYNEISKALDLPLNTVKVYLMRARKKLQEELSDTDHNVKRI